MRPACGTEDLQGGDPADAAHHRIDHALRQRTGQRRVQRVAAGGEHRSAGLHRLRLRRDDHGARGGEATLRPHHSAAFN
jgi:hypothetical protein